MEKEGRKKAQRRPLITVAKIVNDYIARNQQGGSNQDAGTVLASGMENAIQRSASVMSPINPSKGTPIK